MEYYQLRSYRAFFNNTGWNERSSKLDDKDTHTFYNFRKLAAKLYQTVHRPSVEHHQQLVQGGEKRYKPPIYSATEPEDWDPIGRDRG